MHLMSDLYYHPTSLVNVRGPMCGRPVPSRPPLALTTCVRSTRTQSHTLVLRVCRFSLPARHSSMFVIPRAFVSWLVGGM